jgi:hypothetical protein
MSDIQRASKVPSKSSSNPDTGVFPARSESGVSPARTPLRPASGFSSSFSSDEKKASWDELSRERDPDGETKNYSVPPELIALARANYRDRDEVGTLTPLAPKPLQDVVVVVPTAAPLGLDIRALRESDPEGSLQAPSVPIPLPGSSDDPESARTAVYGANPVEAVALEMASAAPAAASPLVEMMRSELAAAEEESMASESASMRPSSRRSSRRARRSSIVSLPAEASAAARAAAAGPPRVSGYLVCLVAVTLVGFYALLCYYANALLAGLP